MILPWSWISFVSIEFAFTVWWNTCFEAPVIFDTSAQTNLLKEYLVKHMESTFSNFYPIWVTQTMGWCTDRASGEAGVVNENESKRAFHIEDLFFSVILIRNFRIPYSYSLKRKRSRLSVIRRLWSQIFNLKSSLR